MRSRKGLTKLKSKKSLFFEGVFLKVFESSKVLMGWTRLYPTVTLLEGNSNRGYVKLCSPPNILPHPQDYRDDALIMVSVHGVLVLFSLSFSAEAFTQSNQDFNFIQLKLHLCTCRLDTILPDYYSTASSLWASRPFL